MPNPEIIEFKFVFSRELIQVLEILFTFISLYGIIFFLLITAENKQYFQKQK